MCGVIVVDEGRSRSTNLGRDAYNDHCLDIVIIIWSSINFPTVICLPTVCYFSREKPETYGPRVSSLLYFPLRSIFICFYFQIYISKNPKMPCCTLFYFGFIRDLSINLQQLISLQLANFWHRYPKGIDKPFNTLGCKYLLVVCRGCLHCISWFSY